MIPAVAIFTLAALAAQPDTAAPFLRAIAQAEDVKDLSKPGAAGERGIYQFTPETWAQYSRLPVSSAVTDPVENERVARQHLAWLTSYFIRKGVAPTPYLLALAWNAGAWRTYSGRAPASSRDYAQRVVNLIGANP